MPSGPLWKEGELLSEAYDATGSAQFKVVHRTDGRFHWELMNPHGTPTARSLDSFDTEDEAFADAELARRSIGDARIMR